MRLSTNISTWHIVRFFFESAFRDMSRAKIGSTLAAFAMAFGYHGWKNGGLLLAIRGSVIFFLVIAVMSALFVAFYLGMILTRRDSLQPTGDVVFNIEPDCLTLSSNTRTETFPWKQLTGHGLTRNFAWLHFNDSQYRFFPRSALQSDLQWSALLEAAGSNQHAA